ncbi:MAG: DUF3857 domain-containing protein, partial [Myxococcales bacterium]|nr:DUF3857 domain-containing protein [Myxococcales bacterium]
QHAPIGQLRLEDRYSLGPLRGERETRLLESRGCDVHLGGGPIAEGGSYYAEARVRLERGGEHWLRVQTPNAFEIYLDGASEPLIRLDARRQTLPSQTYHRVSLAAGEHVLLARIASRHPSPILSLALHSGRLDAPRSLEASAEESGLFGLYLDGALALARGDSVQARERLASSERSALLLSLRIAAAEQDPLRSGEMRRDESRRLLRRMRASDPDAWIAAHHLARLAAAEGRDQQALEQLRSHARRWPRVPLFPLMIAQLSLNRGWLAEAASEAARAMALAPDACAPIAVALATERARDRAGRVEALVERALACDARSAERLREAMQTRRWDRAAAELTRLEALEPPQGRARFVLARAEVARNRGDEAALEALLIERERLEPRSVMAALGRADLAFARADREAAVAALEAALAREPAALIEVRGLSDQLGGSNPFEGYRLDGSEIVRSFIASERSYAEPQVLVLDYTVLRLFEDHSALELTHNIVRVQSEEAVDAFGEFTPAPEATLLRLVTIKPDGTRLEPEIIAGKESISLPNLAIGDYVEFEFIRPIEPPEGLPGGALGERFYFRSDEMPFDRSELVLVMPESMRPTLDPRGPAPAALERVQGGLRELRFRVDQSRPLVAEPGAIAPRERIPSIHWGIEAGWGAFVDGLREVLVDRDPADPSALRLARRVAGEGSARARVRRLYDWVLENIEDSQDVFGVAPIMLASRSGNRVRVLRYLVGLLEIPSELVIVRGFDVDQTPSELADEDTYTHLILRVQTGSGAGAQAPLFLFARERFAPFGFLPPELRGQDGLVLAEGAPRIVLPAGDPSLDRHRIEAEVHLGARGDARIEVVERHWGMGAMQWRAVFDEIPEALRRERFEQGYVSRLAPGARLVDFEVQALREIEAPLELRYVFEVRAFARAEEGAHRLMSLFPAKLGPQLAALDVRTTTQSISAPTFVETQLRVHASGRFDALPAPLRLEGPHGASYQGEARLEGGSVLLERRLVIPRMRVSPAEYP